jgi:hypothetical protein
MRLDTSDTQWQVAHLFEHLIIHDFFAHIERLGIDPSMIIWINGETFESQLYLDAVFYDKYHHGIFNSYIRNIPSFSDDSINYCLAAISAEGKINLTVEDRTKLTFELDKLRERKWNKTITDSKSEPLHVLSERRSSKSFRDITIITSFLDLTEDEQKLLLRLRILAMDLATVALLPIPGIYHRGHSDMLRNESDMAFMSQLTISRGTSVKHLQDHLKSVQTFLNHIDMDSIRKHFDAFNSEPLWQNAPIDYYRSTGIITTNDEIANLATRNNIISLFAKIKFTVRESVPDDSKYINI